jgi:hypothetical protein
MAHDKNQPQYTESMRLIKEAKKYEGAVLEAGLNLERALDLKIEALNKGRYEEAARHREKEKSFQVRLRKLLEEKSKQG